jgi:hypothetical protein
MIKITKDTFQKLLLTELSGESKKPGDLYIFVESSPIFLSTSIAFKIFNYQLRNYPRRVIWTSQDDKIIHLMRLVELPLKEHLDENVIVKLETESANYKQLSFSKEDSVSSKNDESAQADLVEVGTIDTQSNSVVPQSTDIGKISLKRLLNKEDYNPSSLIELDEMESGIAEKGKSLQDLDSWIERIEATKQALNSMKTDYGQVNYSSITSITSTEFIRPLDKVNPFQRNKKQPQAYLFITSFFVCALIFIVAMVFFPTNVYTLEINSPEDSTTLNLSIPKTTFTKQTIKLSGNASIPTSGDNQTGTERATGKVDLINKSTKSVTLVNGSFSLIKDGKKYTHLRNSTLPEEIAIPPLNDLSPVSITIQSDISGAEYNQPTNSTFEILNNLGQKPCGSCIGISTTAIEAGDGTGKKIVTEADQSLLRATVDGILAQQKVTKLQDIKDEKENIDNVLINNDWYKNLNSSYVFQPDIGEPSANTTLQVNVDTEIYYLSRSTVDELLQRENNSIDRVVDVSVLESSGKFDDDSSEIKLKISYKYIEKVFLDKKNIENTINSSDDFLKIKEEIQKSYQSVINIDKKEIGLKIPFFSPAVNIKYIQTN